MDPRVPYGQHVPALCWQVCLTQCTGTCHQDWYTVLVTTTMTRDTLSLLHLHDTRGNMLGAVPCHTLDTTHEVTPHVVVASVGMVTHHGGTPDVSTPRGSS